MLKLILAGLGVALLIGAIVGVVSAYTSIPPGVAGGISTGVVFMLYQMWLRQRSSNKNSS